MTQEPPRALRPVTVSVLPFSPGAFVFNGFHKKRHGVIHQPRAPSLTAELVIEKIEAELASSRVQSSWLIRRAKVRLATKQNEGAKADLEAALKELNGRMSGSAPDPSLLVDRGLVYDLLGDRDAAHKDYSQAKDRGITGEWINERIRATKK